MSAVTQVQTPTAMAKESPPSDLKTLASLLITTTPAFSGPCTATVCPIPTPHAAGFYLHNDQAPPQPQYTYPFATSNPPPAIHAVYARVLAKCGSAEELLKDQLAVAAFLKLHASHAFVRREDGTWEVRDDGVAEMRHEVGEGRDGEGGWSSSEDETCTETDATSVSEGDISEDELSEGEIRSSGDESQGSSEAQ